MHFLVMSFSMATAWTTVEVVKTGRVRKPLHPMLRKSHQLAAEVRGSSESGQGLFV